jgi:hypothetical protein
MEQDQQPLVFPHNLIKMGKDLFEKFVAKPALAIPAGALLVGAAFYLLLMFMLDTCLVTIIPPFLLLGVFWGFRVKRARMLLLAGAIACAVMLVVEAVFFLGVYTDVHPADLYSNDGAMTLRDGAVSPLEGDSMTVFNYTVNVYANGTTPISNVTVLIVGLGPMENRTMVAGPRNDTVAQYYLTTTLSDPINQFVFSAKVNSTWYLAAEYEDGVETWAIGPVYSSSWEVLQPLLYYSAIQAFMQFYVIYVILVGMIWWTRRARRMREKQLEKWETKRKEEEAKTPKDEAKVSVPSLSKAMGLEADDSFVCSECGADVPSDATQCPKCGEKFE